MTNINVLDFVVTTVFSRDCFRKTEETGITVGELYDAKEGDVFETPDQDEEWSTMEVTEKDDDYIMAVKRRYRYDEEEDTAILCEEEDIRIELP